MIGVCGIVVAVTCPWPGDPPHGYVADSQNSYKPGEHVSVSCEPYYVLDGQPELVCGDNGRWSAPMSICKWPPYPAAASRRRVRRRRLRTTFFAPAGGVATDLLAINVPLSARRTSRVLRSARSVVFEVARPDGLGPAPSAAGIVNLIVPWRFFFFFVAGVQACPYPGTVIRGRMSTVKFYYAIDDVITFSCDETLKIRGSPVLKCLKHGKWSSSIPTCVPALENEPKS